MPGEEGPHQQEIDREPRATAHEGRHQDRDQARLLALDRACSHDRRDTAPKAHKHRHKALAVQSYRRHKAIHDKGGSGEVARVLHQADTEVEDEDVG